MQPADIKKGFEDIQQGVVEGMAEFSRNNPEIVEAMQVMNMSMPDYLQAIQAVREAETFSCSSDSDPLLNIGY